MMPCVWIDVLSSSNALRSKCVRGLKGLASIKEMAISATAPAGTALAPVISVSEFCSSALRPRPKAGCFLALELMIYLDDFVVVSDFGKVVLL